MKNFNLKQKIQNNELTLGSWVTIGHSSIIEILVSAGFDWLTIDLEHSTIDLEKTQDLIAFVQSFGKSALVRVSKNEEVIIKRVMDAGANGVIVPTVKNRAEAEQAVNFVKYPPTGTRGVGLARAQQYGTGFEEYQSWLKEHSIVIPQIEHIESVQNLEEIIDVKGVDGIIIGPYDLSASMGYPGEYEREDVKRALAEVRSICRSRGVCMGFHVIQPDHRLIQEKIDEGYRFIAFSIDFLFLGNKAREEMKKIKVHRDRTTLSQPD